MSAPWHSGPQGEVQGRQDFMSISDLSRFTIWLRLNTTFEAHNRRKLRLSQLSITPRRAGRRGAVLYTKCAGYTLEVQCVARSCAATARGVIFRRAGGGARMAEWRKWRCRQTLLTKCIGLLFTVKADMLAFDTFLTYTLNFIHFLPNL